MAARKDANALDWQEVDTDNLSKKLAPLFKSFRTSQDEANSARKKFDEALEAALRAGNHVPDSMFCVIAHKWGKVSYAITEQERTKRGGSSSNKVTV